MDNEITKLTLKPYYYKHGPGCGVKGSSNVPTGLMLQGDSNSTQNRKILRKNHNAPRSPSLRHELAK